MSVSQERVYVQLMPKLRSHVVLDDLVLLAKKDGGQRVVLRWLVGAFVCVKPQIPKQLQHC